MTDDDGYSGPAELVDGDRVVPVEVRLTGQFDPISGSYHWYGRVIASVEVTELGTGEVLLRTPQGSATTRLTDPDPWGRPRVEGFGTAPFQVETALS